MTKKQAILKRVPKKSKMAAVMNISKAQQEILYKMKSEGLLLWTNEGPNYSAWLGTSDGTKIYSMDRRTAEVLFNKKLIKPTDHSNHNLFSYGLAYKE